MKIEQFEKFKELFLQFFPDTENLLNELFTPGVFTPEAQRVRAIRARVNELRKNGALRLVCTCDVAEEFGCTYDYVVGCMKSHNAFGEYIGFQKSVTF